MPVLTGLSLKEVPFRCDPYTAGGAAPGQTSCPDSSGFFRCIAKKKNRNVAAVATARKLVTIAFLMLKNNEPYRYSQPVPTQNKLSRLRVKATGQRRKTGPKKGTAPAQNQGKGVRTRSIRIRIGQVPALREVYKSEELPQVTPLLNLPAGEKRMLAQTETLDYAQRLQQSHRLLRSRKPAAALGGVNPK